MSHNRIKSPARDVLAKLNSKRLEPDDTGRVLPKKGTFNRRHLIDADHTEGSVTHNWMLHATKGWRRRRVFGAS